MTKREKLAAARVSPMISLKCTCCVRCKSFSTNSTGSSGGALLLAFDAAASPEDGGSSDGVASAGRVDAVWLSRAGSGKYSEIEKAIAHEVQEQQGHCTTICEGYEALPKNV